MNPPPQIGSRVRWWNAKGQVMQGTVRAIDVLSDNSHIVVIQMDAGPPNISLPYANLLSLHFTWINPHTDDSSADHVQPA